MSQSSIDQRSLELFLADSETGSEQEEEDVSDYGDNVETNLK